jgi:hypothetical protein
MTTSYAKAYQLYLKVQGRPVAMRLTEQMQAEADAEHRRRHPRRRKINHNHLPDEYRQALIERYKTLFHAALARQRRHIARIKDILFQLAPHADLTPQPEHCVLRTADGGHYHTQGLGANRYACGSLAWPLARLQQAGFEARIEEVVGEYVQDAYGFGYRYDTYRLVTNAADWQLDAVLRQPGASVQEWVRTLEQASVNPRVYDPFLPYGSLSYESS